MHEAACRCSKGNGAFHTALTVAIHFRVKFDLEPNICQGVCVYVCVRVSVLERGTLQGELTAVVCI